MNKGKCGVPKHQSSELPAVAVVILNWNGYKDTIECIESVFRSDYLNFQIVLCDNGSSDDSLGKIEDWARGDFEFSKPRFSPLQYMENYPIRKPIHCRYHDLRSAQRGIREDGTANLILIDIGINLGFAAGNNIGLRYALSRGNFDYVWLLNNDTVVKRDTLSKLLERVISDREIGICGSTIYYYENPDEVQTLGGSTYNRWLAAAKYIKPNQINLDLNEQWADIVEKKMDMVHGASMLVSKRFLKRIGLLSERYFLFSEEIDWATRAKGKFKLGYAAESIVYHKKGRSTGSGINPQVRSVSADYFNIRSRLLFTKQFYPWALPTVCVGLLGVAFNRLRRGQVDRVKMIFELIYTTLTDNDNLLNGINS